MRVGLATEIPPERNGFMDVQGAKRTGWEEAPRGKQLTEIEKATRINRVTNERKRHFLKNGLLWDMDEKKGGYEAKYDGSSNTDDTK